jgi:hypothetical protein
MGFRRFTIKHDVVRGAEGALLLDAARKERLRAAISCRKSEIELSLPHEQSAPSACQIVVCRSDRTFATTKAAGKILLDFIRVTH